ncbi:putative enzyme related to lactoylglutathione lyase [Arthrobacter ginsengisoli]|uniref:Enzyme related to lactoylglutathione lyase n=1 Tax=Arthrobacter ginsengisoli TaxID=1356565 RepID=A0ABU1UF37_9MICC|nr:VOC family protein [Arthrobacter ginsengisoli]MDR7083741.1 putative enzyme related to lactoylglutathione lyase [Arthrobacter ginsengisoli]
MPTPHHSNGAPCWIDLMTSDTEKAKAFYGELFDWTFETGDQEKYGGYITARRNGRSVAGMMQKQEGQANFPDVWSTYLRTDDARATVKNALEHSGQVYVEPMDVPEQGSMAMIGDATGAAVGLWQPGEMKGYELAAEAGTPAWHELHTKDYAAAVTFYEDVFGWDTEVMSDTPEFRYATLGAGDDAKAGIMDASGYLPAEVPSHWQVYFAVNDADASVEKAVSLGAKVIDGPEDSPFGRLATLTDPTGAMFKIIGATS